VDGSHIDSSPFTVAVASGSPHAGASTATADVSTPGALTAAVAGVTHTFEIQGNDQFGNALTTSLLSFVFDFQFVANDDGTAPSPTQIAAAALTTDAVVSTGM